jgi:hypothetical protein
MLEYDPLNPAGRNFRTLLVWQHSAKERLSPPLWGGWEGSSGMFWKVNYMKISRLIKALLDLCLVSCV